MDASKFWVSTSLQPLVLQIQIQATLPVFFLWGLEIWTQVFTYANTTHWAPFPAQDS